MERQGWAGDDAAREPHGTDPRLMELPCQPWPPNLDPGPSLAGRGSPRAASAAASLREAAGPLVLPRTGARQEISHH